MAHAKMVWYTQIRYGPREYAVVLYESAMSYDELQSGLLGHQSGSIGSRLALNMLQILPIILFRTAPKTYRLCFSIHLFNIPNYSRKLPRLQIASLASRSYLHFLLISGGLELLQYLVDLFLTCFSI